MNQALHLADVLSDYIAWGTRLLGCRIYCGRRLDMAFMQTSTAPILPFCPLAMSAGSLSEHRSLL